MKSLREFDDILLDSRELVRKAGKTIICNMGKIIAVFVFVVMLAVTFTEVSFLGFFTESFASSLLLLITSSYIIYFSLEDSGENHGEETEEFKKANERYTRQREKISGAEIEALREFCAEYSRRDLEYRRKSFLLSRGLSECDLKSYSNTSTPNKSTLRTLKKYEKLKAIPLTPKMLLSGKSFSRRSELEDPSKRKIPMLIIKLIPSTLCMMITLSVMLSAKEGLTATDVLNGILKLSALPMIGFKGYSAGYSYVKHDVSLFLESKANVLESFLTQKNSEKDSGASLE